MVQMNRIRKLLTDSSTKHPIFFVGAGLSCEIGFPSWQILMEELIAYGRQNDRLSVKDEHLCLSLIDGNDYLAVGELLRNRMGWRVDDYIRDRFSRPPHNLGSYEYLVRLPFGGIITTNYDPCIETAYAKHFGSQLLTMHPDDPSQLGAAGLGVPFLLKLHGDAMRGSAVLSASDYSRIEQNQPLQDLLYSILYSGPVVFLGYGMSDRDILIPLEKLTSLYPGPTSRKLALMPATFSGVDRRILEDSYRIDVITYGIEREHKPVGTLIRSAFVDYVNFGGQRIFQNPEDFAEMISFDPALYEDELLVVIEHDVLYLMSLPHRWGPFINGEPRAANIAEMLLALKASEKLLDHKIRPAKELHSLLEMIDNGRVKSLTLSVTNLQTHALAMIAMSEWIDLDPELPQHLVQVADWLESQAMPDGWPRFSESNTVSLPSTLVTLAALSRLGRQTNEVWYAVRTKIASELERSKDAGRISVPLAGWTLSYLSERRKQAELDDFDSRLRALSLMLLGNPKLTFEDEEERLFYREDSGIIGVRTWRHVTASICALGLISWHGEVDDELIMRPLGRCIARLLGMQTAVEGTSELLFPMMYRILAISLFLESGLYEAKTDAEGV